MRNLVVDNYSDSLPLPKHGTLQLHNDGGPLSDAPLNCRITMKLPKPELVHPSWRSSTYSALTRMGSKLKKTNTVLNEETSEIERDLCVIGPTGGGGVRCGVGVGVPQLPSNK